MVSSARTRHSGRVSLLRMLRLPASVIVWSLGVIRPLLVVGGISGCLVFKVPALFELLSTYTPCAPCVKGVWVKCEKPNKKAHPKKRHAKTKNGATEVPTAHRSEERR